MQKQPPEVFWKKGAVRNFAKFTGKHLWQRLKFIKKACKFIKKESLAQVFFCEFCKIPKNTFFTEHLWTTALRPRESLCKSSIIQGIWLGSFKKFFCRMQSLDSWVVNDVVILGN